MNDAQPNGDVQLCCHRCAAELKTGDGSFYVVRIEALADPTPPSFSAEDLHRNCRVEIDALLEEMRDLSAQEALDQVYRRLVLYLCGPCYRQWIENPVG
jgi:hypothetical protein